MKEATKSWKIVFVILVVSFGSGYGQYTETNHRELLEGEIPVSEPGFYGEPGATYVLVNDIRSDRSGMFIASNSTLDLNGYEIVYAEGGYSHLPNYGFEEGKTGWDFSRAPGAEILRREDQVFVGEKVLRLKAGEEITSGYIELPVPGRSYFAMCGVAKNSMKVSVYIEDEEGDVVYSVNRYGGQEMQGSPVEDKHTQLGGGFVYAHMHGKPAGKYRVRVRAETDAIIDHVDLRPAMDVGVGIVERTFTNAHHDHLYAGWYHPAFYDYTQNFDTGLPLEEVPLVEKGSEGTITIKNGVIRSGAKGILSWGIQSTAESQDYILDNVKIVSSGINTNAVELPHAKIRNCYFDIQSPFIINRHGSQYYAVDLRGDQPSEVAHSEFYGGQGCLNFQGNNSDIHHNYFANRQMVTNHYSIMAGGNHSRIYDNVFKPESGSGIEIYRRNNISIFNNDIYIESSPPTCEYGQEDYSVNGIRLADYNAEPGAANGCYDNKIYNNSFFITGKDYPEFPNYVPVATAIFYSASGGENYIYDNEVVVNALDPDSKAETNAFYVGGGTIGGVFEDNTVRTNVPAFWLGSIYGDAAKTKIVRNTIIQSPGALPGYAPIRLGHGNNLATEIDFISNTIQGGNEVLEFDRTRRNHTYSVFWQVQIETINADGSPIPGQNVQIYDRKDNLVVDSTTANDAMLAVVLKEYDFYNRLEQDVDPYRIQVGDKEKTIALEQDTAWTVNVGVATSSQTESPSNISYGPNPVDSRLHIRFSSEGSRRILIFDSHQKKPYLDTAVRGHSVTLDLSSLPPGSYFLQVKGEGGVYTEKLIKQ